MDTSKHLLFDPADTGRAEPDQQFWPGKLLGLLRRFFRFLLIFYWKIFP